MHVISYLSMLHFTYPNVYLRFLYLFLNWFFSNVDASFLTSPKAKQRSCCTPFLLRTSLFLEIRPLLLVVWFLPLLHVRILVWYFEHSVLYNSKISFVSTWHNYVKKLAQGWLLRYGLNVLRKKYSNSKRFTLTETWSLTNGGSFSLRRSSSTRPCKGSYDLEESC